ncbi:MAG: aminotransferase class V-fold PLP-dependent enzyme [Ignavibacteriae bacterium]|nr:aminotransferase class V-fold PLP-dependent enzyme [Ignavibacteriota bacterium]
MINFLNTLRADVVGIDTQVPLLDGTQKRYVFLDNGASTPTFRSVLKSIEEYMPWYSGVHRGTGLKSLVSTDLFDEAHETIGKFVGADLEKNVVVLVKNTTEAINKLSNRFGFEKDDVVICTQMEHHSNDLPWRKHATVIHIGVEDDGHLKLDELKNAIRKYQSKLKLVAVTGASNITGICNPIHTIAKWAHEAGAKIFVDAAQLAPHCPINILPDDNPEHIDFIAFTAHKMYAPFGIGVLIGAREFFEQGDPDMVGGGVVNVVTLEEAYWNAPPHREEAGSPNVPGAIAFAKVISILQSIGMQNIAEHETQLLDYAYSKLKKISGVTLYGPLNNFKEKVGVMTFNVDGLDHGLVAAIFSVEGGIGLRNGCFCAHPYVKRLLKVTPEQDEYFSKRMLDGDKSEMPGMVRASLGCYNNEEDIDAFIEMLERVVRREYKGKYILNGKAGSYSAVGFEPIVRKS